MGGKKSFLFSPYVNARPLTPSTKVLPVNQQMIGNPLKIKSFSIMKLVRESGGRGSFISFRAGV